MSVHSYLALSWVLVGYVSRVLDHDSATLLHIKVVSVVDAMAASRLCYFDLVFRGHHYYQHLKGVGLGACYRNG